MYRFGRKVDVQFNRPAQELFSVEQAENQCGVSDCRLSSTSTVTSWAWIRTCACRTDTQHATLVHPRDTAAPGSERVYIDGGNGDLPTCLKLLAGNVGTATLDKSYVGARTSHVERDDTFLSELASDVRCSCCASCGAGQYRPDSLLGTVLDGRNATVGLNNEQRRRTACIRDPRFKAFQIA